MEKKYYVIINDEQKGPYSLKEIKDENLSPQTPIWKKGMKDWKILNELSEFKNQDIPPPFKQKKEISNPPIKNKNYGEDLKTNTANEFKKIFQLFLYSLLIGFVGFIIYSITNKAFAYSFEIEKIYWSKAREVLGYIPSEFVKHNEGNGIVRFEISDANYPKVKSKVTSKLFSESFEKSWKKIVPIAFIILIISHYLIKLTKWTKKHST